MATVPRLTERSVAPGAAPNIQLQNTQSAGLLNINARQTQQAGQAISQAGDLMERARYEAFERANALRVDDALNQATELAMRLQSDPNEGYTTQKGFAALSRESGMPLADEYTSKLDTELSRIASGLGNDQQRQMFRMRANNVRTNFLGGALQYEAKEGHDYKISTYQATDKNATNALILNYRDPNNVALQETRIRAAWLGAQDPDSGVFIPGLAQLQGRSAAWAQEMAASSISGAHLGAIRAALEAGNINGAMAYRKRYGDRMTASDMIQIDGTLQRDYDVRQGAAVAERVVQGMQSTVNPTSLDRAFNILIGTESNGRQLRPDGAPLTSTAGAIGIAQVMPETAKAAAKRMGVEWDEQKYRTDPAYNRALGRNEFEFQVKNFDGNLAKSYAAYNAGPRWVKEAEARASKADPGTPQADWFWQLNNDGRTPSNREETRNYVTKNMREFETGAGKPQAPTLEQMHAAVRQDMGPNASPLALKTALDNATQRFDVQNKAIAQRKDETVAAAMQELLQNGGRYSDLPASTRAKLTQVAPEKVDELMGFGKKLALGDDTTDDRLYLRLTTNPQAMAAMSDAQFMQLRNGLSKADFAHFTQKRADLLSGSSSNRPGDLNDSAVSRVANQRLASIGIDPTPKDNTADSQRVGAIRRFIDSSLIDAQRAAGKKFDDAQVQAHIDGLFAKNVTFRSTFLGFSTGTTGQQMLSMKVGDIPGDQVDRIKKAFKARGNDNPTDADVLGAYWAAKSAQAPRDPRTGSF